MAQSQPQPLLERGPSQPPCYIGGEGAPSGNGLGGVETTLDACADSVLGIREGGDRAVVSAPAGAGDGTASPSTGKSASSGVGRLPLEVSVVMPCLNEAETLPECIRKAREALEAHGIAGEIIVADNGSTDDSPRIARALGAQVVSVSEPGYGSALMGGIAAARGRYIIMGDADDSYDFGDLHKFVARLREGCEMVIGCRMPSGGGNIESHAMRFLHRWIGNPFFSFLVRRWFHAEIHDIYCGMRGFARETYARLDPRCTGMEFATEMVIKASLLGVRLVEIPITLHRDGRTEAKPHLKTFQDGWRTLRFFLLCSPRWLFLAPGLLMTALGLVGYAIALPGLRIRGIHFDAHTLLFASLALLCGYQSVLFAIIARTFATSAKLLPPDRKLEHFFKTVSLERGLFIAVILLCSGIALLLAAINQWRMVHFGDLDYSRTMRLVIPGSTLAAVSFQMLLSSFLVSMLGLRRH